MAVELLLDDSRSHKLLCHQRPLGRKHRLIDYTVAEDRLLAARGEENVLEALTVVVN
jgi:hypothetical protein